MLIRFGGVIALAAIAVWLWAVFDAITAPADRVRVLPKAIWVIIVLLFLDVGAVAWFVLGRPRAEAGARAWRPGGGSFGRAAGGGSATPRRIASPDDDPEFLRRLRDQMPPRTGRDTDRDDPPDEARA